MGSWRSVWLGAVCVLSAGAMAPGSAAASGPMVYTGTGTQQVADAIAGFQSAIGGHDNGTAQGPRVGGFRTLNWDDAGAQIYSARRVISPQGYVSPSGLDSLNFFTANARGLEVATAGSGVEVSSDGFRDLNPGYPALLASPSGRNVFGPLGSTETDVSFEVPDSYTGPWGSGSPGSGLPADQPGSTATVNGVGVVFVNVEAPGRSAIEYLAADGSALGTYFAPAGPAGAPEFVGVLFADAPVAAVRIISGTVPLSAGVSDDGGQDNVVALGDLVSSEPVWGPSLTITTPVVTPGSPVRVTGTTHDPIGLPSVTVGGMPATVSPDGAWTATVAHLDVGEAVHATATDSRGLTATAITYPGAAAPPYPGKPVSTRCQLALSPDAIIVAGPTPKRPRPSSVSGHLTVRATCNGAVRAAVTATLTTITRSVGIHRRRTVTRTYVVRSRPMTLTADHHASQTLALPHQLASTLVDKHAHLRVRLALRAVRGARDIVVSAVRNVRVLRRP